MTGEIGRDAVGPSTTDISFNALVKSGGQGLDSTTFFGSPADLAHTVYIGHFNGGMGVVSDLVTE